MNSRCAERKRLLGQVSSCFIALAVTCSVTLRADTAHAQEDSGGIGGMPLGADPFGGEIRVHYYELLRRSPTKALLLDLALPGAGSVYTHLWGNTIVAATISVVGASLWIVGAVRDRDDLWWAGAGTFAGGRVYGLVSAPLGATLLNAAYRRHLGLVLQEQP